MLIIAESLDELRFDELAGLYGEDLQVEWIDDDPLSPDAEWFSRMKAEFNVYLSARFFSKPVSLDGIRPFYAIWEVDGRYVSAVRVNVYKQGLLLEALQTGENYRKQGYAAALIGAVMAYLAVRGSYPVYAHARDYKVYVHNMLERAGFHKILDYAVKQDPQEWPPYYYKEQGYVTYLAQI